MRACCRYVFMMHEERETIQRLTLKSVHFIFAPTLDFVITFLIFMRFTQTLRRLKDIYECYNLGEVSLKKNENEEEEEEEKFQLLHFLCFPLK